jgi:adenylate cyclase class 2
MMNHLEIEVKFHLEAPEATRADLVARGAQSQGRALEINHILDNRHQALYQKRALLRLRQAQGASLTFKAPPLEPDHEFKIRREIEIRVSDFSAARDILAELGFTTVRIYEKWRETFALDDTLFCLDTLPYGDFLEIEGTAARIRALSAELGFTWGQRSVLNYYELFELVKDAYQLPFGDITFANFEGLSVDMARFRNRFESGP